MESKEPAMNPLIVHGCGGHGRIVAAAARLLGYSVASTDDSEGTRPTPEQPCIIAIGDNAVRRQFADFALQNIIHLHSFVDKSAKVGKGTYIGPHAAVNVNARIGRGVIINTGAIIEHDADIGDWCHISPGAVICGTVTVGEGCWMGANAVVKEGIRIAPWCIIGCGAVVIRDITESGTYVGTPAHNVKTNLSERAGGCVSS